MLLRLFDDTSDIRDSTMKNHHSHRNSNVDEEEAEEADELVKAEDEEANAEEGGVSIDEPVAEAKEDEGGHGGGVDGCG